MNFYRFSISWARVLPDGDIANVNEAGIAYYDKLIDKILEYDIEPVATMYHYDLPHELQKFGGLANSIFISYFESYANLLFKRFGDRVKTWITFNEPTVFCLKGFGLATAPPMVAASGVGEYLCADNVIKAHAVAYHLYKRKYADEYKGKVGITLTSWYYYSDTNNTEDINRAMDFEVPLWITCTIGQIQKQSHFSNSWVGLRTQSSAEKAIIQRWWLTKLRDIVWARGVIALDFQCWQRNGLNLYVAPPISWVSIIIRAGTWSQWQNHTIIDHLIMEIRDWSFQLSHIGRKEILFGCIPCRVVFATYWGNEHNLPMLFCFDFNEFHFISDG